MTNCGSEARDRHAIHRIGFTHSPPLVMVHPDGTPGGLAYDVLTAAANRAGVRLDWRRASKLNHEFLREGAAELWPLADPENSGGFGVTKPWARGSFAMLSLDEARGVEMLVAVNKMPRTLALLEKYAPAASRLEVNGGDKAMAALCSGEATHAFIDARIAQLLLLSRPAECNGKDIRMEAAVGAEMPLGIMYRPGSEAAAHALRAAIDGMALDGSLAHAFGRWSTAAHSSVEIDGLLLESESRASRFRSTAFAVMALLAVSVVAAAMLYRARNLAVEAANAKSHFVAVVSHELRTPLNGFLGLADLLAASPLNPDQKELAEAIRDSAHSFHGVVSEILEFSRIEAGKLHVEAAPCDLNRIAAAALAAVENRARQRGLDLRLIEDAAASRVLTDGAKLRRVLINLADNAVKFTYQGSVCARIKVDQRQGAKLPVTIQVSDSGAGIDPGRAKELFTPFRQAHGSQSRRFGGLGLGLSICKGIIDAMGGTISLSSEPGMGTTVTVRIMVEQAPESVPATEPAPQEPSRPTGRARILVVDDSKTNRLVASRILRKLGHETEEAVNGREAVELARSGRYALILMDCQMPEMDGFEAVRRIRDLEDGTRHVPIVALTASVEASDQGLCFDAGMDGFLQKPVSLENLRQALERFARPES